jgi:hypothetical protein
MDDDVTIRLSRGEVVAEFTAASVAQARERIAARWPGLFMDGPEREAAALEVIGALVVEGLAHG